MQSCADTEWNMSIMGWVWLLVPLRGDGYHRNGEEKVKRLGWTKNWVLSYIEHLSKSRCVRKLESCVSFSPFRGECPMVERTGLGSLCLSKRGGVPRMRVGAIIR